MRKFAFLLGAAATLALVAAAAVACGDDDDNGETPAPGDETVEVSLFFPKATATDFEFPEAKRTVDADEASPEDVVALLLAGPAQDEIDTLGVANPFPAGVQVLSVSVAGDTATVDFSAELLDYGGGSANVTAIGGSITRTVQAATGAAEVVILVEGEPDQLQP